MKRVSISLQNKYKPELGSIKLELPAREEDLNAALAKIEIPYASPERNCVFSKFGDDITSFDHIKDELVNADELNYLAMRLDSFDKYEMAQFNAAAYCENISDVTGLINLTFNIKNYTVATDFSDIKSIGSHWYLDEHFAVPMDKYEKLNTAEIGLKLIQSGNGIVTPFGVVYKHGKELEMPYNGKTFPQYDYMGGSVITVGLISEYLSEYTDEIAWLDLPVPDTCIEKAAGRLGADYPDEIHLQHIEPMDIPDGIMQRINTDKETVYTLNDMCRAIAVLQQGNEQDIKKLDAACDFAGASSARDITVIAENISHFKLYPDVQNAEQYGYKIAEDVGAFQHDQSLDEYFDFKRLGDDRMKNEYGRFSDFGYTVFDKSPEVLDELLNHDQDGGMTMNQ